MLDKHNVVLLPVLLNGVLFTTDVSGNMAIAIDGHAIHLSDQIKSESRPNGPGSFKAA